jgi:hypothetical protein
MKKLVLTIGAALVVGGVAFAQGTIQWTAPAGNFTGQTNTTTLSFIQGSTPTGGGTIGNTTTTLGFYYELLYSTTAFNGSGIAQPNSTAALFGGTWQDAGLGMTNNGNVGRIVPIGGAQNAAVQPAAMGAGLVGVGQTNYIMLVGWSANLGTSWSVVSNELATGSWMSVLGNAIGFFGESATGYVVGNTGNPGVSPFISSGADVNGQPIIGAGTQLFELLAVPEPTTLAMMGLGSLSLLIFRRRK